MAIAARTTAQRGRDLCQYEPDIVEMRYSRRFFVISFSSISVTCTVHAVQLASKNKSHSLLSVAAPPLFCSLISNSTECISSRAWLCGGYAAEEGPSRRWGELAFLNDEL